MERDSRSGDDALVSPNTSPAAIDALPASRPVNAPRRCFICLTDQDHSDPPGSWVDPCPCTLEAHQDCMLSWVTDCERSNKPLLCPVCKSRIELERHWDLVVAASEAIHRRFTRASPFVLFTGVSMGVQFSLQLYGALALWTFAGKDSLLRFLLGSDTVIDVSRAGNAGFVKDRIWRALTMMNVAPALLFGRLLPSLSNKVFLPAASVYGMYHMLHEDDFVSWPPSPRLAIAAFPYVRSVYYNLWRELVLPYECKLNRQLMGLPPVEEQPNPGQQVAEGQVVGQRNADGGMLGILQGIMDVLDPDDANQPGGLEVHEFEIVHEGGDGHGHVEGEIVVQLQIGDDEADGDGEPVDQEHIEPAQVVEHAEAGAHAQGEPDAMNQGNDAGHEEQGHEAPQAPPRRLGVGSILSNVSNAIVGALILPGVSLAMGEALRLALPRAWTKPGARSPWNLSGMFGRPGLLQQQWGRSLIGGCLFVVLKDAVRVYAKSRRVAALRNRRVKNVDRRRRGRSNDAANGG